MPQISETNEIVSASNRELAIAIRRIWMREMGVSEEDIAYHCDENAVIHLAEEMEALTALTKLRELNARQ